jgi:hypothetical protein
MAVAGQRSKRAASVRTRSAERPAHAVKSERAGREEQDDERDLVEDHACGFVQTVVSFIPECFLTSTCQEAGTRHAAGDSH